MPQFSSQLKLLRAVREILAGDGRNAFPHGNSPKPAFKPGASMGGSLPLSTPEAQGLSSAMLAQYYRSMAALPGANLHSLLVLRHGKLVGEGYFAPFKGNMWHVSHSLCKTLVGAAVGIAIEEKLFSLDDSIVDLLPKEAGHFPSRQMRGVTVRHLLTMTSGLSYNEVSQAVDREWLKAALSAPITFEPGSQFAYNSMNSYVLSALVCQKSGVSLTEYLKAHLFDAMEFGPIAWETSSEGYEKGGWGLYLLPRDMAKLGQLYLQKGRWETTDGPKQLIAEGWIRQSTTGQVQTDKAWQYGFHCWVDEQNGLFAMNGMFGQYVIVHPELDMVIAMTAGNTKLFANSPAYDCTAAFLASIQGAPESLPPCPAALSRLGQTVVSLAFRAPAPVSEPPLQPLSPRSRAARWRTANRVAAKQPPAALDAFCHTTWRFKKNQVGLLPLIVQFMDNNFSSGLAALHLELQGDELTFLWEEGDGTIVLPVGWESWRERAIVVGGESFHVASRAQLRPDEDGIPHLIIEVCLLEHSSSRTIKLMRQGGNLVVKMDEQPQMRTAIEGVIHQSESNQGASKASPFAEIIAGSEYVDYRLLQLCTPQLVGTPVIKPGIKKE